MQDAIRVCRSLPPRQPPVALGSTCTVAPLPVFEDLDGVTVSAPPAGHIDDVLIDHLFVFHAQFASHGEMMKGAGSAVRHDVEPGEIAAGGAAVAGRRHDFKVTPRATLLGRVHRSSRSFSRAALGDR